jgi:hypothetical protein
VNGAADNNHQAEAARRLAARDRAADALVANYIHELSDRHGAQPKRDRPRANPPR